MNTTTYLYVSEEKISKIVNILNLITNENSNDFSHIKSIYSDFISYKKISLFSILLRFEEFIIIKYFNKLFIFDNSTEPDTINLNDDSSLKKFIDMNSIGLILNNENIPEKDFLNLKKCYMLTKQFSYNENKEIYCKYKPYYLFDIELIGEMLTIHITPTNSVCELHMNNLTTDFKTFLNEVFNGMEEDSLKLHHKILKYYASLSN